MAALRAARHRVSLLAPSWAGAALVGPGEAEVEALLAWERSSTASLFSASPAPHPEMERALAPFQAVVAYTGNRALGRALGAAGARVVLHPPLPPVPGPHAARWLTAAVAALGAAAPGEPPLLVSTPDEEAGARPWVDRLPARFLAVHPGSGSPRKNWPAERFAAIAEAIAMDERWLLIEGPADGEPARSLARMPSVVRAREVPVRVLGAVLARAGLYVGNDSGVSHLAAAFGTAVLALFGPTDPAQWSPVGPRVTVLRSPDGTMEGIAAEDVIRAAGAALSSPRPPSG